MAVNARFQADFSSFLQAINQAEVKLADFGKGANKVEGSLNKMVDSFSGRKLIQEASLMTIAIEKAGGTSILTARELEALGNKVNEAADKMKRLGYEVPAGMQRLADETKSATTAGASFGGMLTTVNGLLGAFGIGLSISAIVGFGRGIFDAADSLVKMHDKTGISIEGLQRFQVAGDDAGNTLEDITSAAIKMSDNIAGGNASTVAAIGRLGLNFNDIRAMSPEDQFIAISDAIRGIKDPAQQINIAIDIFGKKGGEVLPVLKRGFDDVRGAAVGMSSDTAKSIDAVGDALSRAARTFQGQAANFISFAFLGWSKGARDAAEESKKLRNQMDVVLPPGLPKDLDAINKQFDASEASIRKASVAVKVHSEAHAELSTVLKSTLLPVTQLGQVIQDNTRYWDEMNRVLDDARSHVNDLASSQIFLNTVETETGAILGGTVIPMFATLPNVVAKVTGEMGTAGKAASSFSDTLGKALSSIPTTLINAFTGGGGLSGGLKAIGVSLANDIAGPMLEKLKDVQKAAVGTGSAIAAALGNKAGGGAGAAVAGIASGLGGAAVAASGWGTAMSAAGVAGTVALGAATLGIGAAAVGVVALIRHLNSAEKAVNPVREQFVQLHGGLAALNAQAAAAGTTLTAMLNAKTPEAYKKAIDDLNAAFQFQDDAMATLDETAKRYGFTIEELGPALQRQELGKQAASIFQDWQVLNAAGIDTVAISARMADGVNNYVKQARAMGIEVPAAMKPMLQTMVNQGLLTDDAGNKITDLNESGITFAETMSAGFQKVVDAVGRLADSISGRLGTAISKIPANVTTNVDVNINGHWNIPAAPRIADIGFASQGGLVTPNGIVQYLGVGGRVLPFRPRGTDTVPAMLTPGERVLSVQQNRAYEARTGTDNSAVVEAIQSMENRLHTVLPRMVQAAVQKTGPRR